jgi:transposase
LKNISHAEQTDTIQHHLIWSSFLMGWFILAHLFSIILALFQISRLSESDKDLEIVILRHQLAVMTRLHKKPVKPNRAEKLTLAILTKRLKQSTNQLQNVIRIVQPETVLRWHRELVRRKWTYQQKNKGGRPRTQKEKESLIVRLAKENLRWGYGKIEGELLKLGYKVSLSTVRNVLNRNGILPASVRFGSIGWKTMIKHYKDQLLACDFFVVESIFLRSYYVLFFIELGSRRIHLAGITANPNGRWVAQQARQLVWQFEETQTQFRCLIRDNDSKYTSAFDTVFESQGTRVIPTPLQAPNANCYAERWVRSVRQECLDHILVINEAHLRRVLDEYLAYYNSRRPHQGLAQESPIPRTNGLSVGKVQCR